MSKITELPKGYTCSFCKRENKYSAYVFAHWREVLIHTCSCGAKYKIVNGSAELNNKPKKLALKF